MIKAMSLHGLHDNGATQDSKERAMAYRLPRAACCLWLSLITLLWALQPWLLSQSRLVVCLSVLTAALGLLGWLTSWQILGVWSGGIGLCNLAVALLLTAAPPSLWVGLSAGCTLLTLLDGSQHWHYLRACQAESGVLATLLRVLIRLWSWSIAAGLTVGLLITQFSGHGVQPTAAGLLTIVGAGLFVGFFALFLLTASRWPGRGPG
jgi:hypothetical protein